MSKPIYVNALNINMNETAYLNFFANSQNAGSQEMTTVVMLYDTLKMFHKLMGEVIEQHDKKLNELQRTKANMN